MTGRLFVRVVTFFMGSDQATWAGHALQGLLLGFLLAFISPAVAFAFVVGAFWHRELSDFVSPVVQGRLTWADSWRNVRRDGLADFFTPVVAGNLGIIVHGLLL